MFSHEKLDVYRLALDFVRWSSPLVIRLPSPCRNAATQLIRAADSIPLNIAEGNAKRQGPDRRRYFETARASATECAAALDVIAARGGRSEVEISPGKELLDRIVAMLTRLSPPGR
jgi:four helix bundle protein